MRLDSYSNASQDWQERGLKPPPLNEDAAYLYHGLPIMVKAAQ